VSAGAVVWTRDTQANAGGHTTISTLKLQMQTTVDGYMAGRNGELDWTTVPWTDDINDHIDALTQSVDCIVLGRKLAEGFVPAWASGPEGEDQASTDWMNDTPKVVISNSLTESPWDNAVVAGGDLAETVNERKALRPGHDHLRRRHAHREPDRRGAHRRAAPVRQPHRGRQRHARVPRRRPPGAPPRRGATVPTAASPRSTSSRSAADEASRFSVPGGP
jgi:hypothetical protein